MQITILPNQFCGTFKKEIKMCESCGCTPASGGDEIRAASAVNIVGRIKGDLSGLWDVPDGAEVCIEKV
jgi:hypothetical protein